MIDLVLGDLAAMSGQHGIHIFTIMVQAFALWWPSSAPILASFVLPAALRVSSEFCY